MIVLTKIPFWWPSDKPWIIDDCMNVMKQMPDESVDLVLADPPYGKNIDFPKNGDGKHKAKRTNHGQQSWDDGRIPKKYFNEIFRISKNQIIWGGNYYTDILPPKNCWIVWDKDMNMNTFSDGELAWTSFDKPLKIFKYTWDGFRQENMADKEERLHPTQKPSVLFEWILEKYTGEGDVIFDPFLGSGTTLLACRKTDKLGLGCEMNEEYESLIEKRSLNNVKRIDDYD